MAVATIISLVIYVNVVISVDKVKLSIVGSTMDEDIAPIQQVSLARLRRDEEIQSQSLLRMRKMRRDAETLKNLDKTEEIWLRRSPEEHAVLKEMVSRLRSLFLH